MKTDVNLKTKKRSKIRLKCGYMYYSCKRYFIWTFGDYKFANKKSKKLFPYIHAAHKTTMLRKLKDVEIQYQHNKIVNLKIATKLIDKIVVKPGETFSYWKLIGRPTYKKGYIDGMVLNSGKVEYGCGGGLCQLSNLIFWLTIHTPLEVTERHRHGYDVFPDSNRKQPFGSGATCYYPYIDLMIYNPTDKPYQLNLSVGDKYLSGEWRCLGKKQFYYKVVEKNHVIKNQWFGGYSRQNQLYKQKSNLIGNLIDETLIAENYAMLMYSPLIDD